MLSTPPVRQQSVSADSNGGFTRVVTTTELVVFDTENYWTHLCLFVYFSVFVHFLLWAGAYVGSSGSDTPFPEVHVECGSREVRDLGL